METAYLCILYCSDKTRYHLGLQDGKDFFCYLWSFHKHITNKDVQPADDQFKQATEEIKPS